MDLMQICNSEASRQFRFQSDFDAPERRSVLVLKLPTWLRNILLLSYLRDKFWELALPYALLPQLWDEKDGSLPKCLSVGATLLTVLHCGLSRPAVLSRRGQKQVLVQPGLLPGGFEEPAELGGCLFHTVVFEILSSFTETPIKEVKRFE